MYNGSERHKRNLAKARSLIGKKSCQYCEKTYTVSNIMKHEDSCWRNPINHKACIVCGNAIKNYKSSITCGYSCSNKHFRSGPNNGNWNDDAFHTTCFHFHKKECVVCGESNIVEVHHLDENHNNNDPSNLIPLCPNHHQYWHSRFKHLVEPVINEYIKKWSAEQDSNLRLLRPKRSDLPDWPIGGN